MVCSVGSVKMAVMATLSASGNFSQVAIENAGHQKIVAQYIQKELLEADDANLLDEEDMHIFDLNPLTDPLRLVSCNFCKKPMKASQFVSHSELCRSLGIAEELLSELDSGTGNRKPPRKERKKLVSAGKRVSLTGGQERFAIVDVSETAVSSSQLDEQIGISSSCLVEAKGTSGTTAGLAGEIIPLTKRPKMIAADIAQASEEMNITSFQNSISYVPAPLAAKTYTSQRNNRLQAAISHMYHQPSVKGCCINDKGWQGNLVVSAASSIISEEQLNNQLEKSCGYSSLNTLNTNQTFKQGSAGGLVKVGGQTSNNFVNQISMINSYASEAAAAGTTTTSYHPKPYLFEKNSGLTTVQRSTGGVPVV